MFYLQPHLSQICTTQAPTVGDIVLPPVVHTSCFWVSDDLRYSILLNSTQLNSTNHAKKRKSGSTRGKKLKLICIYPRFFNKQSRCFFKLLLEVSVRAAAAEIIAADFYAAPTDSLLPKKIGSSFRQQGSAPIVLTCCFSRCHLSKYRPYTVDVPLCH